MERAGRCARSGAAVEVAGRSAGGGAAVEVAALGLGDDLAGDHCCAGTEQPHGEGTEQVGELLLRGFHGSFGP